MTFRTVSPTDYQQTRYDRPILANTDTVKTSAGTWVKSNGELIFKLSQGDVARGGWYYTKAPGTTENRWYYFRNNGLLGTGWVKDDKTDPAAWYYTSEAQDDFKGSLVTGWIKDPQDGHWYYIDPTTGVMCTGWKQVDGKWYYFCESKNADNTWVKDENEYWKLMSQGHHSSGCMYQNEYTPDGYFAEADGSCSEKKSAGNISYTGSGDFNYKEEIRKEVAKETTKTDESGANVITATATTSTAQYTRDYFNTTGLKITLFKNNSEYKTVKLPDDSVVVNNVIVNGIDNGTLEEGPNEVKILFIYYDENILMQDAIEADVGTQNTIEAALTAIATTVGPQYLRDSFNPAGMQIDIYKNDEYYKTLSDNDVTIDKVLVNGSENGPLGPGENIIHTEFHANDGGLLNGQSLTMDTTVSNPEEATMTAEKKVVKPQYAGEAFNSDGLEIDVYKNGDFYKTLSASDIAISKTVVNGVEGGSIAEGINNITIEFSSDDGAILNGQTITVSFAVNSSDKIQLVIPTLSSTIFEYSGDTKTPEIADFDESAMTKTGDLSRSLPGDYTISFNLRNTNIYEWSDGTIEAKEVTWKIESISAGNKPTASQQTVSKTYTGEELNNGYAAPEHISVTGDTKGTNAGTYTAVYTPDEGYTWSDGSIDSVSITLTVNKAEGTFTVEKADITYDGNKHDLLIITSCIGGTIKFQNSSGNWSTTVPKGCDAGTYDEAYKFYGDTNHKSSSTKYPSVTIKKAAYNGSVTPPTAKEGLVYHYNWQDLINAGSCTVGYMLYKLGEDGTYSKSVPRAYHAGTYTVYYKATGDNNHNDSDEGALTVTIDKVPGYIKAPTPQTGLVYNGSPQALVSADTTNNNVTIQYKIGEDGTYSTDIPKATDPGTYTVYYRGIGNSDYYDVEEASVEAKILADAESAGYAIISGKRYLWDELQHKPFYLPSGEFRAPDITAQTVGRTAFGMIPGLTKIVLPDSITTLEDYAFAGCSDLQEVVISKGVTSIGEQVLTSSPNLKIVRVDSENTVYDSRDNCNAIIETSSNTLLAGCSNSTVPSSITSIGDYAFFNQTTLVSMTLPSKLKSIGNEAFSECRALTSINLPSELTTIGNQAFYNCRELAIELVIPDTVNSIGEEAFGNCYKITGNITIPCGIETIQKNTFASCKSLTGVSISNSVTSIGNCAFSECEGLEGELVIPGSVEEIGENAFESCSNLTKLTLSEGIKNIGKFAFNKCSKISGDLVIPEGVISIGQWAFTSISAETLSIPSTTTSIAIHAFGGTSGTKNKYFSITVSEENPVYDSRNDCNAIIETSSNTIILGCKNTIIPDTVTVIGDYAFYNCQIPKGEFINIPINIKEIGDFAFMNILVSKLRYKGNTYESTSTLVTGLRNSGVTVASSAFL